MSKAAVHLLGKLLMSEPRTACGMWVHTQRGKRQVTNTRDEATCPGCLDRTILSTAKEQTDDHQ